MTDPATNSGTAGQSKIAADAARCESEDQVRLLSMITHDMIWSWDLRAQTVSVNDAFTAGLGDTGQDYAAELARWRSRVHPDDLPRVEAAFARALEQGSTSVSYEYRILDRTDSYLTVDDRVSLIRDGEGQLIQVFGAMRDITKRKRAEEAQARLIRILEATTDFVGMATADGETIFINSSGRKIIGLLPD